MNDIYKCTRSGRNLQVMAACYCEPPQTFTSPVRSIIASIREVAPTQKIFLLGTYFNDSLRYKVEYDLLVLVEAAPKRQMFQYEQGISNRCKPFAQVMASVEETDRALKKINQGNIFFNRMCHPGNLIYDSIDLNIPFQNLSREVIPYDSLIAEFRYLLFKGEGFLSGAINYSESKNYPLAAFMLHQAVEQALNAFLTPLMGYRLQTHNLNKLFCYARRFPTHFRDLFPINCDAENHLYQTLHKAYIWGRYRCNFKVSQEAICVLIDRVKLLLVMAEDSFYHCLYN